jgi:hypothetical protein
MTQLEFVASNGRGVACIADDDGIIISLTDHPEGKHIGVYLSPGEMTSLAWKLLGLARKSSKLEL